MDKHSHLVTFLNYIFDFVHILPKIGLKQPRIFRVYPMLV